ncbi:MAG: lysine exporter LysO family protein [Bacteroidales bacterium]|nr:lysine exporter LysO family protein [Bacteroidales bacterium]
MLTVVLIMCAGILAGYLLRSKKKLILLSEKLVTWAIFLLLFLLGIAIGANPQIMNNLHSLGLKALLITIGAVAGSITLAWLTYRLFFKNKEASHEQ